MHSVAHFPGIPESGRRTRAIHGADTVIFTPSFSPSCASFPQSLRAIFPITHGRTPISVHTFPHDGSAWSNLLSSEGNGGRDGGTQHGGLHTDYAYTKYTTPTAATSDYELGVVLVKYRDMMDKFVRVRRNCRT